MSNLLSQVASLNNGTSQSDNMIKWRCDDNVLGYITPTFAKQLKNYFNIFQFDASESYFSLVPNLAQKSVSERSAALRSVNLDLQKQGLIPGWRNELFPVVSTFSAEPYLLMERAATPYFGVKAFGVHVNGFVRDPTTRHITHMWAGRRAQTKSTFPGMLDDLVAGGIPYGVDVMTNVVKECAEEASIPETLARTAVPTGAITYNYADSEGNLKRDTLFCFDLELPNTFIPSPMDGEVESFHLFDVDAVLQRVLGVGGDAFKPNCNLVKIDFFIR